ncbi:MAG TPA: YceD family protein [Mycobacteriales bacterium]|jgi:uncharacterized protein|nr:YceD family protein [Mycobacteriales bacterium]
MSSRPPAHIDPRSPFVLDTRELGRRPGSMRELHREVIAPSGWEVELVSVPAGATVELDVRLESVVEGVLVSLEVHAPLAAECGRCLDPVSTVLDVPVAELFVYEPEADDDEVPVVDGDFVDLEPLLRDAIVLALPLNPVCDGDCPGLCVTCGARLADVEPDHRHDELDPRWAALAGLEQKFQDSSTMDDNSTAQSPIRES